MVRAADGSWRGTIDLVPGRTYTLYVVWIETIGERELRLVASGDYDLGFDLDGDGTTNLAECEAGTDPFAGPSADAGPPVRDSAIPSDDGPGAGDGQGGDAEFPASAEITAEVLVWRVAVEDTPLVDGLGVVRGRDGRYAGEWGAATQLDAAGDPLVIGNLMVDGGTDETDGAPRRRWAAVHDGRYLYVLVTVDNDGARFRDSDSLWNDDSLEVYIDGDGSASPLRDEDDVQRTLPLVAPGTDAVGVDDGIVPGFFLSQVPVRIDFRTGPGLEPAGEPGSRSARGVYELRVELASTNIVPGRPFGFELQVNDDDDGLTFVDPSYMGTAVLE